MHPAHVVAPAEVECTLSDKLTGETWEKGFHQRFTPLQEHVQVTPLRNTISVLGPFGQDIPLDYNDLTAGFSQRLGCTKSRNTSPNDDCAHDLQAYHALVPGAVFNESPKLILRARAVCQSPHCERLVRKHVLDTVEQLFYIQRMERIAIRELNQRTSQVLDRIRRGETLIITDHGEPIARLSPIGATRSVLDRLIEQGLATPARSALPFPPAAGFGDPLLDSTAIVRAMRDEE